jgi:hypothetical protein
LISGQRLLSEQLFLKRTQLFSDNQLEEQMITAYHLGSWSGWRMTGVPPRARTEVTPAASQLRFGVLASTANEGHTKPEPT